VIAITFALPIESSDLRSSLDKNEIPILHTGVGRKAAATKIEKFLDAKRPTLVISSGFAGGLHERMRVGDLILCENHSDPRLLDRASQLLANHNMRYAKLVSVTHVAHSPAERSKLHQTFGADAVDMETEVIAAACKERDIPLLALRAISDTPDEPLPAPPHVLFDIERQRTPFVRLAAHSIRHPTVLPRLKRFSENVALARAELTSALRSLLREQRLLC
jgi:adenosylhomocysteine nucleosidase